MTPRTWPTTPPNCRHGCPDAIALVSTPGGCVVFRADTEQYLCAQHIANDGFIGVPALLAEAWDGAAEWAGL